jgi:hypothetical protein
MRTLRFLFFCGLVALVVILVTTLVALFTAKGVCLLFGVLPGVFQRIVAVPLSAFSSLGVLAGALIALIVWVWNIRRQYSDDLLKESQSFFEKSFETLNHLDDQGHPENDRMRWLTSARLLRVAERIGSNIELRSHKFLYEEIRDYWRTKFRDLVQPRGDGFPEDYFAEEPEHLLSYSDRDREPLALSSLRVIYRFVRWPEGRSDPLDNEPRFSEEEIHQMSTFGPRGLGNLLRRFHEVQRQRTTDT